MSLPDAVALPAPPAGSLARRLLWRLTREGRARLALRQAAQAGGSVAARAALGEALAPIEKSATPAARALLRDGLHFRAASALRDGAMPETVETLAAMDRLCPDASARLELRRALIFKLRGEPPGDTLAGQLTLLLADPAAAAAMPEEEVLDALGARRRRRSRARGLHWRNAARIARALSRGLADAARRPRAGTLRAPRARVGSTAGLRRPAVERRRDDLEG